ncbi:MAG: bacteriohemerythrin [Colwellia sp.]|nr:bacteriohemerythrin [Colwellia sp.]MCW8863270.1 bacteriohemerythrin [Colwellia sp.]MCW9080435.1 bacteriohemerythrin [Colwellia sp.]
MNSRSKSFIYAAIIALAIVVIFLGFLSSLTNPISWGLIVALLLISVFYKKKEQDNVIKWKDEYSVGITHIDQDHKKLINLLNQFTIAYDHAMSEAFEKQALEELVNYTQYHFEREEKLMKEHDYPDFAAHQAKHQEMIEQVKKFLDLYDEKGHDALKEISEFLTVWLISHINGTDKEYSQYLNERGVH